MQPREIRNKFPSEEFHFIALIVFIFELKEEETPFLLK